MDKLYEYILEGLRNLSQTKQTENKFIAYLQSLQVEVKNLRQSYRNNSVSVNYSRVEVQAAYLITYYPQYAEMTRRILEQVELSHKTLFLFEQKHLEVCLFFIWGASHLCNEYKYSYQKSGCNKAFKIA